MTDFAAVDRILSRRLPASLDELRRLVALPSVSTEGSSMPECAGLVSEMLSKRGFHVELVPSAGYPVVVADRPGANRDRTLLFYNHYDVQPAGAPELWESPPFDLTLRDGCAFGGSPLLLRSPRAVWGQGGCLRFCQQSVHHLP